MATSIPPRPIAAFVLDTSVPTVRDLLIRLRSQAPTEMQSKGLANPQFLDEADGQWATVTFKSSPFAHWLVGVQFLRKPDETGKKVEAWMRVVGGAEENDLNPNALPAETVNRLGRALESAAVKK